jgi:hypothetical protein
VLCQCYLCLKRTWSVDCRVVNNIIVKYQHPIPRFDDMLDELHGSCIFSKIKVGTIRLR